MQIKIGTMADWIILNTPFHIVWRVTFWALCPCLWGASELQLAHISLRILWSSRAALLCRANQWATSIWPNASWCVLCHLSKLRTMCLRQITQRLSRMSNHLVFINRGGMKAGACWARVSSGSGNNGHITRACSLPTVGTFQAFWALDGHRIHSGTEYSQEMLLLLYTHSFSERARVERIFFLPACLHMIFIFLSKALISSFSRTDEKPDRERSAESSESGVQCARGGNPSSVWRFLYQGNPHALSDATAHFRKHASMDQSKSDK